ncbi:secretion protein HlyD family protein [Methylocaldum marinum]|uniref:Secretion protein HlyD family protein n=1 Tax=Methylocaldum marinum TaxID=1432792 RepID=A0A250KM89_9GAMM|nr:HlyD family efflux transporter periplasmic adaptor subunit [Methylocaldum marinum]BBA32662.1 secretion protein HlyD family protein [Methylocaldum marinum]
MTRLIYQVSAVTVALLLSGCGQDEANSRVVGILEWDRVELIAEASEPIVELPAQEGDWVEPGQILVRLDPARRQAWLNDAAANRDRALARLQELERGPRIERIREARARFQGAEQVYEVRRREFERVEELLPRKLISPDEVDRARREAKAALAERDSALAVLQELEAGTRVEEVEQARQALASAEAAVAVAATNLQRLTVRAPVAGRLDSLPLKLGNQPQAGAVLAVLLSGSAPYARVYIPEPIRVHVMPGDAARVWMDGVAEPYEGTVRMVSSDPVFTPFFALTERDRRRLSYVAKIYLSETVRNVPAGLPVEAELSGLSRFERP